MASIVWADVVTLAPELSTALLVAQTIALAEANAIVRVDAHDGEAGVMTKIARSLRAAHRATLIGRGLAGPVIAETEGALSTQYASPFKPNGDDDDLRETVYGRQYLGLVRRSNARAWVLL